MAGRASRCAPGRGGLAVCHELSDALDESLRALAAPLASESVALVAVGGYGRREQCRHSDVDLMLLFAREPERPVVDAVLYPLWDGGLKVGHSVRTLRQVAGAARDSLETFTALLDARLVAGDEELYERFLQVRRKFVRGQRRWLHGQLAESRRALLAREPWQLQEPDVKSGRGGLRALHAPRWAAHAEAIAEDEPPPELTPALGEARELLLTTRNALHALEERPNDILRRDLAAAVAERARSDRATWSRRLSEAMRLVDAEAGAQTHDGDDRWGWLPWRRPTPEDDAPGDAAGDESDLERLTAALRDAQPGQLEPLPRSAWLERVLPEWELLRNLSHIAPFHLHPVDVHSWRTVVEARRALEVDEDETGTPEAASALGDASELLIAALLHDIGKGHDGDHSGVGAVIAERFAARAGLDDESSRRLATAVQQHLLLPTVATRRDIADERVIREVAQRVGDARTLHLLYLLSVADARASGPDVWNAWKAQLMRALYLRVSEELSDVPLETAVARRRRAAVDALAGRVAAAEVEAHLDQLPGGYLLSIAPDAIGRHVELIAQGSRGEDGLMEPALQHDRLGEVDRLTIVMADRPGILQAVAGTLAVHNVNVLGGVAYTREDGIAIEVMHLGDALGRGIDERRWGRIFEAVPEALAGEFPVERRLAETRAAYRSEGRAAIPTSVLIDNAGSEHYSIVEVRAADRLGLLYAITGVLHELALDIHLAKVDTLGAEVVDAFYVLRENGRLVEAQDEIERIVARVTAAVDALDDE